jgi:PAS domain S-box-containing protein
MTPDDGGPPDAEQYSQAFKALHSLLTAVSVFTGSNRVCLVSPEPEPGFIYVDSTDKVRPDRGRKYVAAEGDVSCDVRYGEHLLGRLLVAGAPGPLDLPLIDSLAAAAGFIMGQARELHEARSAMQEAQILRELGQQVGEHFDLEGILTSIVQGLRRLLVADYASVATLEADGTTRWAAMDGQRTDTYKHVVFPPGKGIAARAIAAGRPVFLEGFGQVPELPAEEFPIQITEGGVCTLGVPLMLRGTPIGALIVGSRTHRKWSEWEIKLATLLANGSALVMHQARSSAQERSQRAILDKVVENFPGVLLVMGPPPDYRVLFANKQYQRFLKEPYRSGTPIVGLPIGQVAGDLPERSMALGALFVRAFQTGEGISFERFESDFPHGGKTWWNWSAVPIGTREAGEERYIVVIATDVTEAVQAREEQAQAAAAAQTRADELEAVISQMVDGVLLFDRAGEITKINPEGEHLLGRGMVTGSGPSRRSEQYGLYTLDGELFEPERLPSMRALRGETVVGEQMLVRRPDGDEIIISANLSPLIDGRGEIYGAVGVFHDITEDIMLERLKDDFLSIVSHELRTPLTAIMGHTDLLLRGLHGGLGDRQGKALRSIRVNADRLLRLINDLLDVSKLEAGSVRLDLKPVDLGDVISRTLSLTRVLAAEARVSTHNHVPLGSLPKVMADYAKLQQVIENLLSNAIKFTPPGGRVDFDVSLSDLPPDDSTLGGIEPQRPLVEKAAVKSVIVTVKDSGAGLGGDQVDLIWDRFYQVDSTAKRQTGGAGLGLAIVRNLVELHGGRIWVRSEGPGRGSAFSFSLPIASEGAAVTLMQEMREKEQ